MKKYLIASLRGSDFLVEADNPCGAWEALFRRERENGSLWKTSCEYRNRVAVDKEGFTLFKEDDYTSGAWKEVV